jgi:hypothetical protein
VLDTAPAFHAGGPGSKLDEEKTFCLNPVKHHLFLAFKVIENPPTSCN